jgi:hypothetical protein
MAKVVESIIIEKGDWKKIPLILAGFEKKVVKIYLKDGKEEIGILKKATSEIIILTNEEWFPLSQIKKIERLEMKKEDRILPL